MDRRDFLAGMSFAGLRSHQSGASASTPRAAGSPKVVKRDSLPFASALEAAEAIRRKKISSVELTRLVFDRIDRYNPKLNAFVYQLRDDALAQAEKADEARGKGSTLGVFHGVPINVKESFAVAGRPCTWGLPPFQGSKAPRDSVVVERLRAAGAILVGATNVPVNLEDWQTTNPIYGTTNNPWDLDRTPGGSSGGSAAALAAGLGYLSVGSDIGGSIRVPAHFCGIFGHKPTLDIVELAGHSPGGSSGAPGFSTLLAVAGPMARTAADLLAALKILAGPTGWTAKAWKFQLPEPRGRNLRDFRVGYVLDDPSSPPTAEVSLVLQQAIEALGHAGAKLKPGWPPGFKLSELLSTYLFLLYAFSFSVVPPHEQERVRRELGTERTPASEAMFSSHADWQQRNFRRLGFRAQWQAYFNEVDVFLSPVAFTSAFRHDQTQPMDARRIATADGPRPYTQMFNWIATATLTGCPSTVAPVGLTDSGLPVGIQIMGPYLEDATPLAFAALLEKEIGAFKSPPGY